MIHNGWAFDQDEKIKAIENLTEFNRVNLEKKFIVRTFISGNNRKKIQIEATKPFTGAEMLLWADNGNLCFGGTFNGCNDLERVMEPGIYTVDIATD